MRWILTILPLALPLYVVRFHLGPLPSTLLEVVALTCLVAWTAKEGAVGWKRALSELKAKKWLLPLAVWTLASLIAVAVAPNHMAALGLWRAYILEPLLVFAMLADIMRTPEDKETVFRSLVASVIIVGFWAVVQFALNIGIPHPWNADILHRRAVGPFPFPNALALFCVPIVALCLTKLATPSSAPRNDRKLIIAGIITGTIAVLLARSVGGTLGIIAAALVALLIAPRTRKATLIGTPLLAIVLLVIPTTRHSLEQQFLFKEWSGKVRLVIWKETETMLKNRPLTGAGLGAYPDVIRPYHKATWMEIFQYPHNILLNLWSELGLLGIAGFAWILVRWGKNGRLLVLPVIVALLVHGLVDVPYFKNDLAMMFWIIISLTA